MKLGREEAPQLVLPCCGAMEVRLSKCSIISINNSISTSIDISIIDYETLVSINNDIITNSTGLVLSTKPP